MHVIEIPVNREEAHNEYLVWAQAEYRRKCTIYYTKDNGYFSYTDRKLERRSDTMSELYTLGRSKGVLLCHYTEFEEAVWVGGKVFFYRHSNPYFWYDTHGVYHRQPVAKKAPEKKSEEEKQAARDKVEWKKKKKDRRGKRWHRKGYGKYISNRSHRAWERQCIHNEEWDEMGNRVRKDIFDPWIWD